MNYQELMDVLRKRSASFSNMQPTPLQAPTLDQIISGIQSQYQAPQFQQPQFQAPQMPSSGAGRFVGGPQTFAQQNISPVAQSGLPSFTPGAFDLAAFTAKPSVSDVIDTISSDTGGSSGGDTGSTGGQSVDPDGLAQSPLVSPTGVTIGSTLLGLVTGLPVNLATTLAGKQNIADAINAANYAKDVSKNTNQIADMMGIPNTPENQTTIQQTIDQITAVNAQQNPAISESQSLQGAPGTTGANVGAAAVSAADAATAAGYSDAAIGAAAQAAADAARGGASQAQAEAIGAVAASQAGVSQGTQGTTDAMSGGFGSGISDMGYGVSDTAVGAPSAAESAAQSESFGASLGSSTDSGSGGGGGKIVCTAMNESYGFGSFRNRIWLKYSAENMTKAHEVGYHALFLPLVDLAYKKNVKPLRVVLENIARHRSADLRAEMRNTKRDNIGRVYRAVLEPICYFVGKLKGY